MTLQERINHIKELRKTSNRNNSHLLRDLEDHVDPEATVYKAFSGVRQSLYARSLPKELVLTYRLGRWNKPAVPESKIFVFASLDAAQYHIMGNKTEIWECLAKNVRLGKGYGSLWERENLKYYQGFWRELWNGFDQKNANCGNRVEDCYCDKLKLVKCVWRKE